MYYPETKITLRDGRTALVRSPHPEEDAPVLLEWMATEAHSRFLMRDEREPLFTLEQEVKFLQNKLEAEEDLFLVAFVDGEYAGNCNATRYGKPRIHHRCTLGIALMEKFTNNGLGRELMKILLAEMKRIGCEQAELEVVGKNARARHVYESLGFATTGIHPRALQYADGTYDDDILMVREL